MGKKVKREVSIPNDTRYLSIIRKTVIEVITESGFPDHDANLVSVAVDEAIANVIEHAFDDNEIGHMEIEVSMEADEATFEATISDTGRVFDPGSITMLDIKKHVMAGRKNGLGIYLMKKIMDRVVYSVDERKYNQLRLIKYADKDGKQN